MPTRLARPCHLCRLRSRHYSHPEADSICERLTCINALIRLRVIPSSSRMASCSALARGMGRIVWLQHRRSWARQPHLESHVREGLTIGRAVSAPHARSLLAWAQKAWHARRAQAGGEAALQQGIRHGRGHVPLWFAAPHRPWAARR
jgi:hypothetical protein